MLVTKFKVFITRNGNGGISYIKNKCIYKVIVPKEDKVLIGIFYKYYNQLERLKFRYYAIAKWIARDIRNEGYVFKAYSGCKHYIKPIKYNSLLEKINLQNNKSENKKSIFHKRKDRGVSSDINLIN